MTLRCRWVVALCLSFALASATFDAQAKRHLKQPQLRNRVSLVLDLRGGAEGGYSWEDRRAAEARGRKGAPVRRPLQEDFAGPPGGWEEPPSRRTYASTRVAGRASAATKSARSSPMLVHYLALVTIL